MDNIFLLWKSFLPMDVIRTIQHMNKSGVLNGIIILPKRWDSVIEKQGDYIEGLWTDNLKETEEVCQMWNAILYLLDICFIFDL